jgi:hypothetical protein
MENRNRPMTDEYRNEQLTTAKAEWTNARVAYDQAKTRKAKRDADEDLQFWGNKVAFLTHAK